MKNSRPVILVYLAFVIVLYGCFNQHTLNKLPTQPENILTSSTTVIYSPTVILGSKTSPPQIRSNTPTETPTIGVTSTPVYLPTLSPVQVNSSITDMFTNNSGCLFPCWWGIIPGETNWEEALKLLSPLASRISSQQNHDEIKATFYFNQTPDGIDPFVFDMKARKGIIQDILITSSGSIGIPYYDLSDVLKTYGIPEKIWVDAYGLPCDSGNGQRLVTLRLFYKTNGALIQYDTWGEADPTLINACIDSNPLIYLWFPEFNLDYTNILQNAGIQVGDNPSLSGEESLGMDNKEFYQKYGTNSTSCVETPRELWNWCDINPTP